MFGEFVGILLENVETSKDCHSNDPVLDKESIENRIPQTFIPMPKTSVTRMIGKTACFHWTLYWPRNLRKKNGVW